MHREMDLKWTSGFSGFKITEMRVTQLKRGTCSTTVVVLLPRDRVEWCVRVVLTACLYEGAMPSIY